MKQTMLACALMAATFSAAAKDKMIPLAEADATALSGKTIALTVHERPSFTAMTAGKASFGLFGAGAMIAAGNKLVDENHVVDPAEIVRSNLTAALRDAYGVQLLATDATATKATKPKEIATLHPEADYVLDVRSGGWMYAYFPTDWNSYWVAYSVQVQLIDTKTSRQVSNAACNSNTHENANPPSRDQLQANGAQLLKDVTSSLGWTCVQLLAKEQFHVAPEKVAATPAALVNPLANIAAAPAASEGGTTSTVVAAPASAPAAAATTDAVNASGTTPADGATAPVTGPETPASADTSASGNDASR
ncbi:hypothetical protein [Lysobacter fragariae]